MDVALGELPQIPEAGLGQVHPGLPVQKGLLEVPQSLLLLLLTLLQLLCFLVQILPEVSDDRLLGKYHLLLGADLGLQLADPLDLRVELLKDQVNVSSSLLEAPLDAASDNRVPNHICLAGNGEENVLFVFLLELSDLLPSGILEGLEDGEYLNVHQSYLGQIPCLYLIHINAELLAYSLG